MKKVIYIGLVLTLLYGALLAFILWPKESAEAPAFFPYAEQDDEATESTVTEFPCDPETQKCA